MKRVIPLALFLSCGATQADDWVLTDTKMRTPLATVAAALLGITLAVGVVLSVTSCDSKPPPNQVAPRAPPAPNPRVIYELREKCGKDAQEWFTHFYEKPSADVKGIHILGNNYTSHYNEKLNRCFAVVSSLTSLQDEKTKAVQLGDSRTLSDVLENKDIGSFYKFSNMPNPMACKVVETNCASENEFTALVASYMEK